MGSAAPAPAPASPLTPSLLSSHSSAVWPQSWLTPVTMEAGLTGDTEDHTMEVPLLTVEDMVDMGDMDMARDLQSLSLVMDTLLMVILATEVMEDTLVTGMEPLTDPMEFMDTDPTIKSARTALKIVIL